MNWFEKFFAKRIFNWITGKLDGHKTKLGGAGMIAGGIGFVLNGLAEGSYEQTLGGLLAIGKGMEAVGLAGKHDKETAAIKELTDEQKRRLLE